MTDPSPLGIDNEEVVVLDNVSAASTAKNTCMPAVNASTPAAVGKDTEVTNVFTFFNPLANTAKKPRCNMLRGCFKITPNVSGGMIIQYKNCTHFGASNCIFFIQKECLMYQLYLSVILEFSSIFRPESGSPSTQLLQEETPCNVWEWQLKCVSISFRIARLGDFRRK
jgi:hypothetical protein